MEGIVSIVLNSKERFILLAFITIQEDCYEMFQESLLDKMEKVGFVNLMPRSVDKKGKIGVDIHISSSALERLKNFEEILQESGVHWKKP